MGVIWVAATRGFNHLLGLGRVTGERGLGKGSLISTSVLGEQKVSQCVWVPSWLPLVWWGAWGGQQSVVLWLHSVVSLA